MAGGRHADVSAIHLARSAIDDGDDCSAFHAYPRLVHHGAECLQRLHLYHHLDHRVPHDKPAGTEVQARITSVLAYSRLYSVYSDDEGANVPRRRIGRESVTNMCSTNVTSRLGTRISIRERSYPSKTIFFVYLFHSYIVVGVKINGALVKNRTDLAETVVAIGCREEYWRTSASFSWTTSFMWRCSRRIFLFRNIRDITSEKDIFYPKKLFIQLPSFNRRYKAFLDLGRQIGFDSRCRRVADTISQHSRREWTSDTCDAPACA